MLNFMLH